MSRHRTHPKTRKKRYQKSPIARDVILPDIELSTENSSYPLTDATRRSNRTRSGAYDGQLQRLYPIMSNLVRSGHNFLTMF